MRVNCVQAIERRHPVLIQDRRDDLSHVKFRDELDLHCRDQYWVLHWDRERVLERNKSWGMMFIVFKSDWAYAKAKELVTKWGLVGIYPYDRYAP